MRAVVLLSLQAHGFVFGLVALRKSFDIFATNYFVKAMQKFVFAAAVVALALALALPSLADNEEVLGPSHSNLFI